MAPYRGAIHRRPRSDSGAARLWQWARTRRAPWLVAEAAEAAGITARRARAIVTALGEAGYLDCTRLSDAIGEAAEWRLSEAGRALAGPPILVIDGATGLVTGARAAPVGSDGNAMLQRAVRRSGLSGRAAAAALGVNDRTLRRLLCGETPIPADDPIIARARSLR